MLIKRRLYPGNYSEREGHGKSLIPFSAKEMWQTAFILITELSGKKDYF